MKLVAESLYEYRNSLLNEDSVGFAEIADLTQYTTQMTKGTEDKIGFLSKIKPDCILDFGCADGYILNQIRKQYPDIKKFIGYDIDDKMVTLAKSKFPEIKVTDNWKEAFYNATEYEHVALTLMSVIHEVYSYAPNSVRNFWKNQVFNPKFRWVVIRDMVPSKQYMNLKPTKEELKKVNSMFSSRYYKNYLYRKSFEKHWGPIDKNYLNLFHWLLKYDYKRNWKREVLENYFPVSVETIKSKIPNGWSIKYQDHYVYQPVADKIKKDWGIELRYPTHLKMIVENTNIK
jgi:SAM-dependent methyltransferase